MSTISPELLTGFLIEAQGYIDSLREGLAKRDGTPDKEHFQEMHRKVHTLIGALEMLGLEAVAALAVPAEEMLEVLVETGIDLSNTGSQKIAAVLDQVEAQLNVLTEHDDESSDGSAPPASDVPRPDLPAELLEIFALEAREHSQAIQGGLERLRKSPGDSASVGEVARATHTLKGAAASVGFRRIARLAHLMEETLERHLESGDPLASEAIELLLDSADALEDLIEPGQVEEAIILLQSIDTRYEKLLGEAYAPPEAPEEPTLDEEPAPHPVRRTADLLRIPLESIDLLINSVGEMVINQATFEEHLGEMGDLLSELNHSTRRLRRVAHDVDVEIETALPTGVEGQDTHDPTFDSLELERYSLLHQLTRELAEVTSDTGSINDKLTLLAGDLDGTLIRERRLTTELQDGLMSTRLVPFHEIETRLRRTVRRTARDLGKSVEVIFTGFDTEVDKTILDTLADPLMHLLRNAVDHGVEAPEAREAAGKPHTGLVTLSVSRGRGRVTLRLSDDGVGIDLDRVHRQALEMGIVNKDERPSDERLLDLLFEAGFSLAETVTETSGRGIGLDIVRRAVNQLQGTVRVDTTIGSGTTFTISVPITLAITRALFVRSYGQMLSVPLEQISAVLRLGDEALKEIHDQGVLRHDRRALAVYNLTVFVSGVETAISSEQRYGLVVGSSGQDTVVLIDGLVGTHEIVVKSLGTHLRRVHGVSGATISGDGRVVLILDLVELVGTEVEHPVSKVGEPRQETKAPPASPHVLVVDDSLSVRRVVCSFLERAGWRATAAKDGIDALEKLVSLRPDVALVDIEMPRMNGYELLSTIKSEPDLQGIPVIFLTSRSAAKHRRRAAQLSVDGYLVKPYREDELLKELVRVTRT